MLVLVVTTPVAVALLASYVILLIAGSLVALACLAAWIRQRFMAERGERAGVVALSVLAAVLVYWIATLVPFVGIPVILLAFVTGAGSLILVAARLYKQSANP